MVPGRHPKLTRWLRAGLRGLVALLLVLVLPSRPAMAGCFDGLGAMFAEPAPEGEKDESDGCCPSKRASAAEVDAPVEKADEARVHASQAPRQKGESSVPGCPCHDDCPPGCNVACGFAAIIPSTPLELGPVMRLRVLDAERVADPPSGVGPEILHIPR